MIKKRNSGKRHCEGAPQGRPKQSQKRDCFVGADVSKGLLAMTLGLGLTALLIFGLTNAYAQDTMTLDLKGIDVTELFRILSLKMGVTIVPTKSVAGRVNIFLNNLTFDDALDVILVSQDLACEKKGHIINIMTATEYQNLYGEKYNEKRKFKTVKLAYAKPQTVFNALGQIKSDVGKIIVDESSGTIFMIDTPEKLELMEKKIKELDQALETDIFYLDFARAEDVKTQLAGALTPGIGEIIVDSRVNKVMISDYPEKVKKIKQIIRQFDREGRQVFLDVEVVSIVLRKEYQKGINWESIFRAHEEHSQVDLKGVFPVASSFSPSPTLSADSVQLAAATLSQDHIAVTVQALETFGDTRVLAHEYLSVAEKGEAKLTVGSREPVIMQAIKSGEAATIIGDQVEFVDVGLKVKIAPEFNEDDIVTLNVTTESSVLTSITKSEKSYAPNMDKAEAATVVKVQSGTAVMVAGMHNCDIRRDSSTPLPGLSLLGTKADRIEKTEVLIFITPYFYGKARPASRPRVNLRAAEDLVKKEVKTCIENFTLQ